MATATYIPIATQTLGSAAASITFSSIPGTYTDLRLVLTGTCTSTATFVSAQFNGVTSGTLYSNTTLGGDGSTAQSANNTNNNSLPLGQFSQMQTTTPTMFCLDLFSYSGATNKTMLFTGALDQNGSGGVEMAVGLFRSTSAITSIKIYAGAVNLNTGTIATLFGI